MLLQQFQFWYLSGRQRCQGGFLRGSTEFRIDASTESLMSSESLTSSVRMTSRAECFLRWSWCRWITWPSSVSTNAFDYFACKPCFTFSKITCIHLVSHFKLLSSGMTIMNLFLLLLFLSDLIG